MFQSFKYPSSLPEAIIDSVGEKHTDNTLLVSLKVFIKVKSVEFHNFITLSQLPETIFSSLYE